MCSSRSNGRCCSCLPLPRRKLPQGKIRERQLHGDSTKPLVTDAGLFRTRSALANCQCGELTYTANSFSCNLPNVKMVPPDIEPEQQLPSAIPEEATGKDSTVVTLFYCTYPFSSSALFYRAKTQAHPVQKTFRCTCFQMYFRTLP
jgi:hypothetical protein